ncbi:DUF7530 family protein [Halovenus sp. HT40]|uniref:DUF7530 family protein n=1 Tax=Halovenus sp. HT40 TaxID=3126691 RepID=UPI00300F2A3E
MSSPYSDSWVYEGIVGALPGIAVSPRVALLLQFLLFEAAVLVLGLVYNLPEAAVAGTVAVVVSTVGSAELIRIGDQIRDIPLPEAYRRLLFGSNIEVVLSVLAYIALITHLFVFDPGRAEVPLLEDLLGPDPPVLGVYLMLLILWDVCYRIGAGWWASVAALWRTVRYEFDPKTRGSLRRADGEIALFGLAQGAFLPFLIGQPVLFLVVAGHIAAVLAVTGTSMLLLSR